MSESEEKVPVSTGIPQYKISGTGYVIKAGTGERIEFTFSNDDEFKEDTTDADA